MYFFLKLKTFIDFQSSPRSLFNYFTLKWFLRGFYTDYGVMAPKTFFVNKHFARYSDFFTIVKDNRTPVSFTYSSKANVNIKLKRIPKRL